METKIRTDLLRQLADHLINGQLGHKVWDFSTFNNISIDQGPINACGTNGCAAGECPILWPDKFGFMGRSIILKGKSKTDFVALAYFFNIEAQMADHLFCPSEREYNNYLDEYTDDWEELFQMVDLYGGQILDNKATKQEVVSNILIFCDKAEAGQFE